ncbi:peptidyl-prolyl cis-trans isomerase [Ideonella sp. DXS22W]|uniref:Peptidyl-prolyl cis-trans isomerase n=1 Tax=Pseudaquabacterium inlustre TaxID=2984192 RepID=A0ABU9CDR2_9BURK
MREPLLHFLLLGGLLFAVDHVLVGRADDPRVIVMDAAVDKEARDTFRAARGREPDAKELEALRQVWLSNEVLYREGRALQLDQGDPSIRERVIFKALSMVEANLKPPAADDAELRRWFEAHRDKYDEPARYDFQEAVLAADANGPDEAAVRAFVATLNGGGAAGAGNDARAGLRVYKGRPHANLVQSYGVDFAKALEAGPVGEWRALATRENGREVWRAMRLEAVAPARAAAFEPLRNVVRQDWIDTTLAERRSAAIKALATRYTIRSEAAR